MPTRFLWRPHLALSEIIASDNGFTEPAHQRRANSTFRDTNPQLVRANPERSRHRLGIIVGLKALPSGSFEGVRRRRSNRLTCTDLLAVAMFQAYTLRRGEHVPKTKHIGVGCLRPAGIGR